MSDPTESQASRKRDAAHRTAQGVFQVWEDRKALVKKEMADASAANDAKTIRLKALRLEKEKLEADAAKDAPPPAPKKRAAKTAR